MEKNLAIYHVKRENWRRMAFMNIDFLRHFNYPVNTSTYELVYEGELQSPDEHLENIYIRFNDDARPADYYGHSMSVSDVVVVEREEGKKQAYFVDSFGFKEVPDFFDVKEPVELTADSTGIIVEGYEGTWHVIDTANSYGKMFYMLMHDKFDENLKRVIVNAVGEEIAYRVEATSFKEGDLMMDMYQEGLEVPFLPDPSITKKEMRGYGYMWPGMLPMREAAALKCQGPVYRLYEDGTEGMVESDGAERIAEIKEHAENGGIFGIEKGDWMHLINNGKAEV